MRPQFSNASYNTDNRWLYGSIDGVGYKDSYGYGWIQKVDGKYKDG